MILSYADKETERLSRGERVRRFLPFERVALRKLRQLELAAPQNFHCFLLADPRLQKMNAERAVL